MSRWPRCVMPQQKFNSAAQMEFAKRLATIPGIAFQSIARWAIRAAPGAACISRLSRLRQRMNVASHYEPTGDEVFD